LRLARDIFRNQRAVEASVLDKDLIGVHTRHENSGQVHAGTFGFECLGIQARAERFDVEADAVLLKELRVRMVARHSENEIVYHL